MGQPETVREQIHQDDLMTVYMGLEGDFRAGSEVFGCLVTEAHPSAFPGGVNGYAFFLVVRPSIPHEKYPELYAWARNAAQQLLDSDDPHANGWFRHAYLPERWSMHACPWEPPPLD